MKWLIYEGNDGIDAIFDPTINKSKKHTGDDTLVPFKTKVDKNRYDDNFEGVVGAFTRLISETEIRKKFSVEGIKTALKSEVENGQIECSEENFNILFSIIKDLYFRNNILTPINTKALTLIESNITQRQVAEYLYSLFVEGTNLKEKYKGMSDAEDTNALEKMIFDIYEDSVPDVGHKEYKGNCYLPYVKEVFTKDFSVLLENTDVFKSNIKRFLAYYYMFYVTQLAVKLGNFEKGDRNTIESIYMTLNWEGISKSRSGYELGWKYVLERLGHMFSHSFVLQVLSHNVDCKHYDYIGLHEKFLNNPIDKELAAEIRTITKRYESWIPMDYVIDMEGIESDCKTSIEIQRFYKTVDYQFIHGGRISHYNGYNRKFIDFVQKNFGKRRGTLGYTIGVNEDDIIMFTQIILKENNGKIRLSSLFEEFDYRGLHFDRESTKKVTELFEKMNLLEKRSDSGDAQYVKSIL